MRGVAACLLHPPPTQMVMRGGCPLCSQDSAPEEARVNLVLLSNPKRQTVKEVELNCVVLNCVLNGFIRKNHVLSSPSQDCVFHV